MSSCPHWLAMAQASWDCDLPLGHKGKHVHVTGGEGVGIMIGGCDESVIDSLEDVLHLKPEHPTDRTYGNYRRPVCPCGSVCDHAAVTA